MAPSWIALGLAGMFVALCGGCGAPPEGALATDAGVTRDTAWRPRDVPRGDAPPLLRYARSAVADLDRPDAGARTTLDEDQVAGVLATLDASQIRLGNLAQERSVDPRVRAFGAALMSAHVRSSDSLRGLSLRLGLTPTDSPLSLALRREYSASASHLASLGPETFDGEFVRDQVALATQTIELIDGTLIPNATDQTLRNALETELRPMVMTHQTEARDLLGQLEAP